jgi:eukaryotic-like serine/threonine-protein kinase
MHEALRQRLKDCPVHVPRSSEVEAMGAEIGLEALEATRLFDRLKGVSWRGDYIRSDDGWVREVNQGQLSGTQIGARTAHNMWHTNSARRTMLGAVTLARSRPYLERVRGYIISFQGTLVEGGKALEASVGTLLGGRYRIQSTLGAGGMAVVYEAEDAVLGRKVALKTLHRRYAEVPSFRRRFRQEARAMACLDHENIVKVFDISQDGEVPFIVAECVAGRDVGTLLARRRGGHLNERFVRRMTAQLLRALSYAHRRGVIHRDIKPSNILVAAGGTVKVADFGIARIVEEEGPQEGEIVGSARYMSPEQLMGKEATPRSDIYSVGVLLYHCLTGKPPFSGDVRSLAQQHIREAPTPPRELNEEISPHMQAVILKALAKDPEERYPSAAAMLDDIEVEGAPKQGKSASAPRKGRKGLVLASTLVVLLGGALALEYVDLSPLDRGAGGKILSRAEPVETKEPPAAPEPREEEPSQNLAASPEPRDLVAVPDVRAYFDYFAEQRLASRGFEVRFVYGYQEGYSNRGVTWATDPAIGTRAPRGSTVIVYATPEDLPQPRF